MAILIERLLECEVCGTRLEEWDPKEGGHLQAYHAETFLCPGCVSIGQASESAAEDAKKAKLPTLGVKTRIRPRKKPEHMRVKAGGKQPLL